jgi:hypothetical protein
MDGMDMSAGAGQPSAAQLQAAATLLAETRKNATRFNDLAAAKADGYRAVTPPMLPVVHYVNPRYLNDAMVLDPGHPQSLIYVNSSHGPVLVGAMYLMPRPLMHGPEIGGPLTHWHSHSNLCFDTKSEMIVAFTASDGSCPAGSDNRVTPEMLHVWLVDNPDGPFSPDMSPSALRSVIAS